MTVDEADKIDIVAVDEARREVRLVICDHFSWDEKDGTACLDDEFHVELLEDKFNAYLHYVESGELRETFPEAAGKQVVIDLVTKYPLGDAANVYLDTARATIEAAGCVLRTRHAPIEEDDVEREADPAAPTSREPQSLLGRLLRRYPSALISRLSTSRRD